MFAKACRTLRLGMALLALSLGAPASFAAGQPAEEASPTPVADTPIEVGPNGKVGSRARTQKKVESAVIGTVGGLLGLHGGGGSSDGPQVATCKVSDREMTLFTDPASGVSLKAAAKRVRDKVVVFAQVVSSPDHGTFQTGFLRDVEGRRAAPRDVNICALWGEWSLSVSWTRSSYVNDQQVSHDAGGWTRSGEFSLPGEVSNADRPDGLWRRLGFSNASYGAREIAMTWDLPAAELAKGPLDLVIHVTRPGLDPVITTPFRLKLGEPGGVLTITQADEPRRDRSQQAFIPAEVVIALSDTGPLAALEKRFGLKTLEQYSSELGGVTLVRLHITDGREVPLVVAALAADPSVLSAQPNQVFELTKGENGPLGYAPARMELTRAHKLARGDKVLVAVLDSGVDASHPELQGVIAGSFDALGGPGAAHGHGTATAALIAGHARLTGAAPGARILTARVFDSGPNARGTSFNILKGLDWAVAKGARVINMSFAGPPDPALHRALEGAWKRGVVLVAAAGNGGPKSPPLYPGADPRVIAVTATDERDHIYSASNRGGYIGVAAPGVDLLVAAPQGGYVIGSGTSFSSAEVSGVVALMLERKPKLSPDQVRALLMSTGRPVEGVKLVDAFKAVSGN